MSNMKIVYDTLLFEPGAALVMGENPRLWRVLEVDQEQRKALLAAENPFLRKPYAAKWSESAVYEESEIHYHLELLLYSRFFKEQEKEAILESEITVKDHDDPFWNEIIKAHLFLLSEEETLKYNAVTGYFPGNSGWWLRDHRQCSQRALCVNGHCSIRYVGEDVNKALNVRPAFWLDLDSEFFRSLIVKEEDGEILYHGPLYAVKGDRLCFVSTSAEQLTLIKNVKEVGPLVFHNCRRLKRICFEKPDVSLSPDSFYNCPNLRLPAAVLNEYKNQFTSLYPYYPDDADLVKRTILHKSASVWMNDAGNHGRIITLLKALSPPSMERMIKEWPKEEEGILQALAFIPYFHDVNQATRTYRETDFTADDLPSHPYADLAAAKSDHKRLMGKLEELAREYDLWLAVWPVYADESDMDAGFKKIHRRLIKDARIDRSSFTEELTTLFWLNMLENNHTVNGLRLLDYAGLLEKRAQKLNTDPDALRKKYLSVLPMGDQGYKTVCLGPETWIVRIDRSMNFVFYKDTLFKEKYDHLPKDGVDPEEYKTVVMGLNSDQQKLRDAAEMLKNVLLREFLSGQSRDPGQWKKLFIEEPFIRLLASRLVFVQNGHCFTVNEEGGLTDASGGEYRLGSEAIALAHPMEMEEEEAGLWKKRFAEEQIKPLLGQMEEPVFDPASITVDRYQGYEIPDNRFREKEAEGIVFRNRMPGFKNCEVQCQKYYDSVGIEKFSFDCYDRQVNHIVGVLEKICTEERIKKNDTRAVEVLPYCDKQKLLKLFRIAQKHDNAVLIAALMEQLNQKKEEDEAIKNLQL